MYSAERRTSLFWTMHGQTGTPMSLPSLPGLGSGSPRSLTIGCDRWLPTIIVLQSLFLVGPFTDRARVGTLRPRMNFLMRRSTGLEIQIHASERHGRRARGSRSWSRDVERYWCWTAWSRCKIRLVHKKDDYVSLRSRLFSVNWLPLITAFA